MAEEKKYFWLRLKRDFFKRHDIQIIEGMPNGKDYILFYLKLLCESVDHEGNLRFSDEIPYNEQMLSTITNTNIDIVRTAIKAFTELGMMDILDDGTLYMNGVEKLIGSETYWAERKRIQKAKKINANYEYITVLSNEQIALPNGETKYIDEKRYGGNGKAVWERAKAQCEICGSNNNLCIHHANDYSNDLQDLILVCRSCHRKIETGEIGNFPISPTNVQVLSNQCQGKSKSKSIEKELEIEIDKKNKEPKHKYGEYQHVMLTDSERNRLMDEYGEAETSAAIKFLDEYIEEKGYTSKSHNLAMRRWVFDAIKKDKKQPQQSDWLTS